MFDTPEQVLETIRVGGDSLLECRAMVFASGEVKRPGHDELTDELAAFANTRGGVVVLGVHDTTREVVGIPPEHLDRAEQFAAEIVRDSIRPPLYPVIERMELPGTDGRMRPVLRVEVARSLFVHESPGGYLQRAGGSKRIMESGYLAWLFQQRNHGRLIRFDELAVPHTALEDLDPELVDRFCKSREQGDRPILLQKLGMATDERGSLRPSVAGVLLGARHPEQWLRHAFIQAVAYRGESVVSSGDEGAYQLDAGDITGPLDVQVVEACRFVLRNQRVAASKGVGRSDLPQYDITAVFEAVVNAVAHRDYSMHEAKIRLRMFSNRLEIYSPGSIANTMTIETLAYRQASRNETITSLLAKCRVPAEIGGLETQRTTMMDRRGEGVSLILERSERLSGKRPRYELIDESELRLTIFAASADEA